MSPFQSSISPRFQSSSMGYRYRAALSRESFRERSVSRPTQRILHTLSGWERFFKCSCLDSSGNSWSTRYRSLFIENVLPHSRFTGKFKLPVGPTMLRVSGGYVGFPGDTVVGVRVPD